MKSCSTNAIIFDKFLGKFSTKDARVGDSASLVIIDKAT
jgi:hypothetical protein